MSVLNKTIGHKDSNYGRVGFLDPFEPPDGVPHPFVTEFSCRRSSIKTLYCAGPLIIIITLNGIYAAYHRSSFAFLCYLNPVPTAVVNSSFHNSLQDTIVTVYMPSSDASEVFVTSCSVASIAAGSPAHTPVFDDVSFTYPSYLEWDLDGHVFMAFDAVRALFILYGMADYAPLFYIEKYPRRASRTPIRDVRLSSGHIIVINDVVHEGRILRQPVRVLTCAGIELGSLAIKIHSPAAKIELLEYATGRLLIRKRMAPLQAISLDTGTVVRLPLARGSYEFTPVPGGLGVIGSARRGRVIIPPAATRGHELPVATGRRRLPTGIGRRVIAGFGAHEPMADPDTATPGTPTPTPKSRTPAVNWCFAVTAVDTIPHTHLLTPAMLFPMLGAEQVSSVTVDEVTGSVLIGMVTGCVVVYSPDTRVNH